MNGSAVEEVNCPTRAGTTCAKEVGSERVTPGGISGRLGKSILAIAGCGGNNANKRARTL